MTHKQTATAMIAQGLRNSGFQVQYNLNDDLVISLDRPIGTLEVSEALYQAGYDSVQFDTRPHYGQVIVSAIVG